MIEFVIKSTSWDQCFVFPLLLRVDTVGCIKGMAFGRLKSCATYLSWNTWGKNTERGELAQVVPSVVTVLKFLLMVGFGMFCGKNLGFGFISFLDESIVNIMSTVHSLVSVL